MTNTYIPVDMSIGSGRIILINVRQDVATYFGIAASTTANDPVVTRRRKSHSKNRFEGLTNVAREGKVSVSASEWQTYRRVGRLGSGRKVRIPTKLTSGEGDKKNIRYTSIRFPGNATVGAIGSFLFEKCSADKRPPFFIMESGAKYPVAKITGDVNPGEDNENPPPTNPS